MKGNTSMWSRHALFLAVATATLSVSAEEQKESAVQLSNVVVSAAGFEQNLVEAPGSISVISAEDLRQNRYNSLAHALSDVEGIDIGQGVGKTGGLNISIRGMPSSYTLVLIDGRRQNSAGNVTPNGFGETSTSFMPPLSSIERIEIIRGPASTLYGSDALGGVINIITKKVSDQWSGTVTLDHTYQENRDWGDTSNASLFLTGPLINDVLGLQLRASGFNREKSELEFVDGVGVSKRGPSPVDGYNTSFGARLTYIPHVDHRIDVDVEKYHQWYNNDEGQLGNLNSLKDGKYTVDGYDDELEFNRQQITLSHNGQLSFGSIESSLMHNETETIGRLIPGTLGVETKVPGAVGGDPRELKTTSIVFDTKLVAPIGESHQAVVGAQVWNVEMYDGIAQTTFDQNSWSLFAEDKWRLTDDLSLTLGGRYDEYDAFGGHFSPRAYAVWNLNESWTVKGGVSQGYKAPDVNDLHSGVNGATSQGKTITIGNPDLKPEITTSSEVGVYFDTLTGFSANATVFHNQFKDKIADGDSISCPYNGANGDPGLCSQKVNVDKAMTQGFEVAGAWEFIQNWKIGANYTFTDSEQQSGNNKGQPLTNTPEHIANLKLDWKASDYLNVWLKSEYRGERARFLKAYEDMLPNTTEKSIYDTLGKNTKAYNLLHLGASYQISSSFRVNAAIYNLLDKDFTDGAKEYTTYGNQIGTAWGSDYIHSTSSTTGVLQEGRRYWLSLNYDF